MGGQHRRYHHPFFAATREGIGSADLVTAVPFEIADVNNGRHGDGSLEALRSTVKNWCVG